MELHIIPIVTFLCVAIAGCHATSTPELYWRQALPNTAMPKAIWKLLPNHEWMDSKGTTVNVQKGSGVHVNTGGAMKGGPTSVDVGHKGGVVVSTGKPNGGHTNVNVSPKGGVGVSAGQPYKSSPTVGVGKGGVIVHAGPKKKPVYVSVKPGSNPFVYNYAASETQVHDDPTKAYIYNHAASETQVHDDPTRALFFLEKDMKPGHEMMVHFSQNTNNNAAFLSREEAQSLPFSTDKMPEILREFSVQPGSEEAQTIEETIKGCESKGIEGEQKYCATSLEDMVDYAKSTVGKNVKALSTEAKNVDSKGQKYRISRVTRVGRDGDVAVCHKQNYGYAVFYCHKTKGTSPYVISLVSEDGTKTKAVAVCHQDTSGWNPKHLAFQVLNVKPGTVPICHFLPEDHIVWLRD